MKNEKLCSQINIYLKRKLELEEEDFKDCVGGQLKRLKPRKKISKIGLSWANETWISASDRGRNSSSDVFYLFYQRTYTVKMFHLFVIESTKSLSGQENDEYNSTNPN
jgi:hypothetical protein